MHDTFLISDTHIGHCNVIKYDNLSFTSVYEMNDYILERWNLVVKIDDNVLHLGDLFCGDMPVEQRKKFILSLNGNIVLVRGNHDKREDEFYINELGLIKIIPFFVYGKYFFCHYPLFEDAWFAKRKKQEKEIITLLREAYKESKCEYVFHGHAHNPKTCLFENHYNCIANKHDFTPFKFEDKIKELNWGQNETEAAIN